MRFVVANLSPQCLFSPTSNVNRGQIEGSDPGIELGSVENPTRVMMGQGANKPPVPDELAVLAMEKAEPMNHDSRDPNKP